MLQFFVLWQVIFQHRKHLGIPEAVLGLTKKKRGLVLVTGPTGSGKSTTLASLIDVINKERNEHIITLEDPIEYLHKHNRSIVNQREIGLGYRFLWKCAPCSTP